MFIGLKPSTKIKLLLNEYYANDFIAVNLPVSKALNGYFNFNNSFIFLPINTLNDFYLNKFQAHTLYYFPNSHYKANNFTSILGWVVDNSTHIINEFNEKLGISFDYQNISINEKQFNLPITKLSENQIMYLKLLN